LGVRRFLQKACIAFFGYYLGLYGLKNITIYNLYIGGPLNYKLTSRTNNAKPVKIWRGVIKVHIIKEYNILLGEVIEIISHKLALISRVHVSKANT
jgi:hypothetical protein